MKFEEFGEMIKNRIEDICGQEFSVCLMDMMKNNRTYRKGLYIKEESSAVAPTIYLEDYYTDYCDGRDMEDIINEILKVYSENKLGPDFDPDNFRDPEWIKERLFYRLVSAVQNEELLTKIPSRRYLDLAVVFCVHIGEYKGSTSFVTVKDQHLELWGMEEDELEEAALANTKKLFPEVILNIKDVLGELTGEGGEEAEGIFDLRPCMYVMTNKSRLNGAGTILYPGVLKKFAKRVGSDLYVIPSSIHEVILVPGHVDMAPEDFLEMIREVNDTQVSREEVLSYSLYIYRKDEDRLDIAGAPQVASA